MTYAKMILKLKDYARNWTVKLAKDKCGRHWEGPGLVGLRTYGGGAKGRSRDRGHECVDGGQVLHLPHT